MHYKIEILNLICCYDQKKTIPQYSHFKLPKNKEESGCIAQHFGDTLSDSWFDFENRAQSEARELPTSGCASVMEGPTMVLIVFIALYYTYKREKHR